MPPQAFQDYHEEMRMRLMVFSLRYLNSKLSQRLWRDLTERLVTFVPA